MFRGEEGVLFRGDSDGSWLIFIDGESFRGDSLGDIVIVSGKHGYLWEMGDIARENSWRFQTHRKIRSDAGVAVPSKVILPFSFLARCRSYPLNHSLSRYP